MTQSIVTIEGLTQLANDLKNKLDTVEANNKALYTTVESQMLMISRLEKQRNELLEALEEVVAISDRKHNAWDKAKTAIAKAKGE